MKSVLAKAIGLVIAGTALSGSAAASTTMYNTFTTTDTSATDGWTRTFDGADVDSVATGPESQGNKGTLVPWVGTTGNALPYSYSGSSHLNWAVQLSGAGDSAVISAADSAKYAGTVTGFTQAEIDTGGGAWNDNGLNAQGQATVNGPTGWRHQTDIGLISSDVTQKVTINLSTTNSLFSRFGVTVFEGMDTNTGNYSHHGSWNCPGCTPAKPFTAENPFGTTGLTNIGHSDNVTDTIGYTFTAEAGKVYSLYLGGVGFDRWNSGVAGYKLDLATSPVPVPGAVWLFGSAIAGMIGVNRRRLSAA
ncbi:hypothetical protein [Methylomonas sp. CM2]|uniref:hypothetical protein n=1 Tax=Methylomonas sp. CM2 TaxID=3417647 RepID=UPI003CFAF683